MWADLLSVSSPRQNEQSGSGITLLGGILGFLPPFGPPEGLLLFFFFFLPVRGASTGWDGAPAGSVSLSLPFPLLPASDGPAEAEKMSRSDRLRLGRPMEMPFSSTWSGSSSCPREADRCPSSPDASSGRDSAADGGATSSVGASYSGAGASWTRVGTDERVAGDG